MAWAPAVLASATSVATTATSSSGGKTRHKLNVRDAPTAKAKDSKSESADIEASTREWGREVVLELRRAHQRIDALTDTQNAMLTEGGGSSSGDQQTAPAITPPAVVTSTAPDYFHLDGTPGTNNLSPQLTIDKSTRNRFLLIFAQQDVHMNPSDHGSIVLDTQLKIGATSSLATVVASTRSQGNRSSYSANFTFTASVIYGYPLPRNTSVVISLAATKVSGNYYDVANQKINVVAFNA